MRTLTFILLVLFAPGWAVADPSPSLCGPESSIPAALLAARVVVFGETHGTVEAPRLVGDFACQLGAKSRAVVVGLEIASVNQESIDRFLRSAGDADDIATLLSAPHWLRKLQDGRSSEAMLGLIGRVREMRAAGYDISILAIDQENPDVKRDAAMASVIRNSISTSPRAAFVILVGNVHASKAAGAPWDAAYEPLAYLLKGRDVVSLDIRSDGGKAWVCTAPQPPDLQCAATRRSANVRAGRTSKYELGSEDPSRFDGTYYLGRISASKPANSARGG